MPPEPTLLVRMIPAAGPAGRRCAIRPGTAGALAATLAALIGSGCHTLGGLVPRQPTSAPVVNSAAAGSSALAEYVQLLQKLVQGRPAEQAEIVAVAQHEYDLAPTPSHQLKLALVLGAPGHPARDLPKAQGLLRELMANPEMLMPVERALATLELSQIDDHLTLEAENRRLQSDAAKADQQHKADANQRLQAELAENAKLRRDLEEARAKLDAIANIERSLNERKPGSTGR
jgi:hypothetical protein